MCRLLVSLALVVATSSAVLFFSSPGRAADLVVKSRQAVSQPVRRVVNGCPTDRLSCYPLYGAYGPGEYGGAGYWGSYSLR